ncbi:MAG: hypothetical protein JRC93_00495 [Deltaproteobacteria bacterium]|nr:hypothetical protein [Deltaproteobacteria bacterium]
MSGLVGSLLFDSDGLEFTLDMAKTLIFTHEAQIKNWGKDNLNIARVHHGKTLADKQPVCNEDESIWVMIEGEIFNWEGEKENLINRGCRFRYPHNDAEYCLRLWEAKGEKGLRELNGSFVLVIYNSKDRELNIVTDRFSSCPLFYYYDDHGLIFATQLSPLLLYDRLPKELDRTAVFDFFTFKAVQTGKSYYKSVRVLLPATIFKFALHAASKKKYWDMQYHDEKHSEEYFVEALADGIKRSVERRTSDSKKRYGVLLSGGLDSRAVLACIDSNVKGITLGDYFNREVSIAKKTCEIKGCEHIFLKRDSNYFPRILDRSVRLGNGMFSFVHAHNLGFVNEITNQCDVLLSGFGFDTFFKGLHIPMKGITLFGSRFEILVPRLSSSASPDAVADLMLKESLYGKGSEMIFRAEFRNEQKDYLYSAVRTLVREALNCGGSDAHRMMDFFVFHGALQVPEYLHVLHNRAFIKERTVSFDNELFDIYLKMPYPMRANGKVFRKVLKRIDPCLASLPSANTGFRADIPPVYEKCLLFGKSILRAARIIPREGQGLPDPTFTRGSWPEYSELIRRNESMKLIINSLINDNNSLDPMLFDIPNIRKMFNNHLDRKENYVDLLLLLMTFGSWHQKYGLK